MRCEVVRKRRYDTISTIFKGQDVQGDETLAVPKRRFEATSCRVITPKTDKCSSTAAEAYDIAKLKQVTRDCHIVVKKKKA